MNYNENDKAAFQILSEIDNYSGNNVVAPAILIVVIMLCNELDIKHCCNSMMK